MEGVRKASHSGSWYSDSAASLGSELNSYLSAATLTHPNTRLLIVPHAGYAYSGPTAGFGYKQINPNNFTNIFLLGPSHHSPILGCYLPCSSEYATPLGNISISQEIINELKATQNFKVLTKKQEEKEHSLEMHLPFIRKVFENKEIQLVPIMVGELNSQNLEGYGKIFQRYLQDPRNLFIISSDFCHWGNNFDYKPYDRNKGEIFEFIEDLDRTGMGLIEQHDLSGFLNYLERTENTICGRNPICIAISMILHSNLPLRTSFIRYAQSNPVRRQNEFSVSYATSVSFLE